MWPSFSFHKHQPSELNRLIIGRYRGREYQIWWLVFSDPRDMEKPDLTGIFEDIEILEEDVLIPCGVDFKTHVEKRAYPDINAIVDQLPKNLEQLVLGGYHQDDCVDKVAACAYNRGINTFVDEDTTEHFFPTTGLQGDIPLIRDEFRIRDFIGTDEFWVEYILENRKDKPWLTQKP